MRRRCSRSAKWSSRRQGGSRHRGGGEHGRLQSQLIARCARARSRRAARRLVVGRQRRLGRGAQDRSGPRRPLTRRGSMPICIASKAMLPTPVIGTARPENRLRPVRSKPNGSGWFRRCSGVETHECDNLETDQGRHRRLGNGDRAGSPCPGHLELKAVLRRLDGIRRRAEQPCLAGRCGDAGHAAGDQRGMRAARRCAPVSA